MLAAQGLITDKDGVNGEKWTDTGERYMKEPLSRSLLQEPRILFNGELFTFKMHDLVHDLALDVMGEELVTVDCRNDHHHKVPRFVRHISWGCTEHLSSKEEILRELLPDSIGDLKHLRHLDLSFNARLNALPNSICKLLNLQTLELKGCLQLEKLPEDTGKLKNLTCLSLSLPNQSKYLIPKRMIVIGSSLRHLFIARCSELISLLEEEDKDDVSENIIFLTQLRTLEIYDCPKFSPQMSKSLRYLTSLNKLVILSAQVDGQMELPPQPTATVGGMKPDGLRSLKYLFISWGLPDVLQTAATSLRRLHLLNCAGVESLPEWLRNFKSLSHLFIINCPQLSTLPSDGFLGLTSLQELYIQGCPHLSLRCSENGWDNWRHISDIFLDGKRINFKREYVEDSE